MTNKEAIELLKPLTEYSFSKHGIGTFPLVSTRSQVEALKLAINALEGKWIPVSERLPEDMQRVLIWYEYYRYGDFNCMYQTYGFGYVCDGKWSPFINGETGWQDYRIIAWQPLPEPYKEEVHEE